jgi:hypothetical protein
MKAGKKTGKKTGGRKAGTPNKKTVMLSTLGIFKYQDLTEKLITSWIELLDSQDKTMKLTALKELSKLAFDSKSTFTNKVKILTGEPEDIEGSENGLSFGGWLEKNENPIGISNEVKGVATGIYLSILKDVKTPIKLRADICEKIIQIDKIALSKEGINVPEDLDSLSATEIDELYNKIVLNKQ